MIRKLIPPQTKRKIRLWQRAINDRKKGYTALFAEIPQKEITSPSHHIKRIQQPIFYNPLSANKVYNIGLAISEIQKVIIPSGGLFSFWHIVGDPTLEKGYKTGRNIIGDSLQEDVGGGLCQVSGMIYHLALITGMEIIERHNHTIDLYEEDKRYTPLGSDATVVYGYKDLRFKNTTNGNVQLQFSVSETTFEGHLFAEEDLPEYNIRFEREEFDKYRTIKTFRTVNNQKEFINLSRYLT